MKHIFLTSGRRAELRGLIKAGDPVALYLAQTLHMDGPADSGPTRGSPNISARQAAFDDAQARICVAWLENDRLLAARTRDQLVSLLDDQGDVSDLGKAANALAAVLAWDFGNELWEASPRQDFAARIGEMARSFLEISKGNPHTVTNNWWMLTHGACLLACIAVDGEDGPDGPIDLSDLKAWALERFKAFCGVFGNAGLYHEGSGYIAYTLSMLLPAMIAVERHLDPHILDSYPQFRRSVASMLVGTAPFEHADNGADQPTFGAALQWNDAGRSCAGLNPLVAGIVLAPDEWKGAMRTVFDRLTGLGSKRPFNCHYRGLPLFVALYPFSTTPVDPNGVLPRRVLDQRQGLGMWRSQWGDGRESVIGWYARSTHPGGHSQDDAASIRLMALGRTWICGGGQARGKAAWQSVFTHADMAERPRPSPLAHISACHLHDTGGVVGMDTRQSLGAYSERYLSWRTDLGQPLALAIMDLLDEHRDPPLDWQWNLSFPRELLSRIHPDGAGFTLVDEVRGSLYARFLLDRPDALEVCDMPPASRTYANGTTVDYPGDRFIHAGYPACRQARILVALVIREAQAGGDPKITLADNSIRLDGVDWSAPFSPAILKSVKLGQSPPNRMTRPAG